MTDPVLDLLLTVRDHRRQRAAAELANARSLVTSAAEDLARAEALVLERQRAVDAGSMASRRATGERINGDVLRRSRENRAQGQADLAAAIEQRDAAARVLQRAEAHLTEAQKQLRRAEIGHEKIASAHADAVKDGRKSAERRLDLEAEDQDAGRWSRGP